MCACGVRFVCVSFALSGLCFVPILHSSVLPSVPFVRVCCLSLACQSCVPCLRARCFLRCRPPCVCVCTQVLCKRARSASCVVLPRQDRRWLEGPATYANGGGPLGPCLRLWIPVSAPNAFSQGGRERGEESGAFVQKGAKNYFRF